MKKIDKAVHRRGGLESGIAYDLPNFGPNFGEDGRVDPTLRDEVFPDELPTQVNWGDPQDDVPVDPLELELEATPGDAPLRIDSEPEQAPGDRPSADQEMRTGDQPAASPANGGVRLQGLATTPVSKSVLSANRICMLGNDPATDAFRMVRTQLLQQMDENGWRSLAVVSAVPGDGKSVVAMNLALAIAEDPNHTALLVDTDLRNPTLHRLLGLPAPTGLESYFEGMHSVADVLLRIHTSRFALIPCRERVSRSRELLASAAGKRFVNDVCQRYDDRIVLFDLPSLLQFDDALALLPQVDAVLLVVGEGVTKKSDLDEIKRLLRGKPVAGVVLNQTRDAA